jgi:hypothetical protein
MQRFSRLFEKLIHVGQRPILGLVPARNIGRFSIGTASTFAHFIILEV